MNRFGFVIFCEYINNMQRNSQKENSLAPYLCLGSKGNKFLHYTAQGGSICAGCSAILCMLVHNANLSRDKLFYIPGPLPGRKAEENRVSFSFLFLFFVFFSFIYFIIIVYCERSFFTEMMTHSLYKTDWELDPSLHNTRPGVGSTPQIWVCTTSTGVVFSRFCPLRYKIEYDFRGSHGDQDIGEPVVTSSSRIFNEYPPPPLGNTRQ